MTFCVFSMLFRLLLFLNFAKKIRYVSRRNSTTNEGRAEREWIF